MQTTYADEMVRVFKRLDGDEFDMASQPDSSAFSHARSKLEPTAFVELNSLALVLVFSRHEACEARTAAQACIGSAGVHALPFDTEAHDSRGRTRTAFRF